MSQILQSDDKIIKKIMKQLQGDAASAKPNFLAELALNSYKGKKDSQKDFLQSFSEGATFQAYTLDYISKVFPTEFNDIKMDFMPLANKLGISMDELV